MHSYYVKTYQKICNQNQHHTNPTDDLKSGFWEKVVEHII